MRGRSYSYSPSPPPRSRRVRSPSPRDRYRGRSRELPTSLLVRNLRRDCRPEDLRRPFGQFGPLKDVYLPRDYYTGEPRGFGFVQYVDPADAAEAKYRMDRQILLGRELTVVFAEENRKRPAEMRARECGSSRGYDNRRSSRYSRSRSRSSDHYSPSPGQSRHLRSVSPDNQKYTRHRSYSPSPSPYGSRSRSPDNYSSRRSYRERSVSLSQ
ncbi:hypothetical protein AMTR_s00068p00135100 [Amborella trichopoda]|uniref:RRM domain-containing protein n=2 Tax=Amborella trichopoda TaxID=13333 RepID=U5DD41_AMBTC|nr:hypothetical protein AMTR_s00068p00135100 [Amborella trichopoda]